MVTKHMLERRLECVFSFLSTTTTKVCHGKPPLEETQTLWADGYVSVAPHFMRYMYSASGHGTCLPYVCVFAGEHWVFTSTMNIHECI